MTDKDELIYGCGQQNDIKKGSPWRDPFLVLGGYVFRACKNFKLRCCRQFIFGCNLIIKKHVTLKGRENTDMSPILQKCGQ